MRLLLVLLGLSAAVFAGCSLLPSHDRRLAEWEVESSAQPPAREDHSDAARYILRQGDERPVLRVYNWNDYLIMDEDADPSLPLAARSPTLRAFMDAHDCIIDYIEYYDREEMISNVQSLIGYYDVVMTTPESLLELLALDRLQPLEGKVDGMQGLDARLRYSAGRDLMPYFAPYLSGSTALVYRRDLYPNGFPDWGHFFQPTTELHGRIGLLNEPYTMYLFALLYLGADVRQVRFEDIDAATALYRNLIGSGAVGKVSADVEAINAALREGELHVATQWVGNAVELIDSDDRFAYVVPQEGAELWVDSLVVMRDAPNLELALRFVEYLLEAEVHGATAAWLATAATSEAARRVVERLAPEQLRDGRIYPSGRTLDKLRPIELWDARIPEQWRILIEPLRNP